MEKGPWVLGDPNPLSSRIYIYIFLVERRFIFCTITTIFFVFSFAFAFEMGDIELRALGGPFRKGGRKGLLRERGRKFNMVLAPGGPF